MKRQHERDGTHNKQSKGPAKKEEGQERNWRRSGRSAASRV